MSVTCIDCGLTVETVTELELAGHWIGARCPGPVEVELAALIADTEVDA